MIRIGAARPPSTSARSAARAPARGLLTAIPHPRRVSRPSCRGYPEDIGNRYWTAGRRRAWWMTPTSLNNGLAQACWQQRASARWLPSRARCCVDDDVITTVSASTPVPNGAGGAGTARLRREVLIDDGTDGAGEPQVCGRCWRSRGYGQTWRARWLMPLGRRAGADASKGTPWLENVTVDLLPDTPVPAFSTGLVRLS